MVSLRSMRIMNAYLDYYLIKPSRAGIFILLVFYLVQKYSLRKMGAGASS